MDIISLLSVVIAIASAATVKETPHSLNVHTCRVSVDEGEVTLVCHYRGDGLYAPDRKLDRITAVLFLGVTAGVVIRLPSSLLPDLRSVKLSGHFNDVDAVCGTIEVGASVTVYGNGVLCTKPHPTPVRHTTTSTPTMQAPSASATARLAVTTGTPTATPKPSLSGPVLSSDYRNTVIGLSGVCVCLTMVFVVASRQVAVEQNADAQQQQQQEQQQPRRQRRRNRQRADDLPVVPHLRRNRRNRAPPNRYPN